MKWATAIYLLSALLFLLTARFCFDVAKQVPAREIVILGVVLIGVGIRATISAYRNEMSK